jgi:regulator of protease activity HflC (stomatin/prohibitin superfamily)
MFSPLVMFTLLSAVTVAFACVRRIPEGQAYTLRRIGGHLRTVDAGIHVVLPGIERIAHKIHLLGNIVEIQALSVPGCEQPLHGQVYFQVLDAQRADAVIDRVGELVSQRLPDLLAAAGAEENSGRNVRLKAELNRQLRERGILITRVQLA